MCKNTTRAFQPHTHVHLVAITEGVLPAACDAHTHTHNTLLSNFRLWRRIWVKAEHMTSSQSVICWSLLMVEEEQLKPRLLTSCAHAGFYAQPRLLFLSSFSFLISFPLSFFQFLPGGTATGTYEEANKEDNKEKNRYPNILPCERTLCSPAAWLPVDSQPESTASCLCAHVFSHVFLCCFF